MEEIGVMAGKHCKTKNSVPNPINEEDFYFLADALHLLKNVKECLINNKIIELPDSFVHRHNLQNNLVKAEYVKTFCNAEGELNLKFAPKLNGVLLTSGHFSKMKVCNALSVIN